MQFQAISEHRTYVRGDGGADNDSCKGDLRSLTAEEACAPEFQALSFGRSEESLHVCRRRSPIDGSDFLVELCDDPLGANLSVLVFPRTHLIERCFQVRQVRSNVLSDVPTEVVPIASLDIATDYFQALSRRASMSLNLSPAPPYFD